MISDRVEDYHDATRVFLQRFCAIGGLQAHLTSNCKTLVNGINSNRVKKESGEVRFALPENLTRIIGVEQYLETMQVGFWAYGVEISEQFVLGLLTKLMAAIVSIAPIVLLVANIPTLQDIKWCVERRALQR